MLTLTKWAKRILLALLGLSSALLIAGGLDITTLDNITALVGGIVSAVVGIINLIQKS